MVFPWSAEDSRRTFCELGIGIYINLIAEMVAVVSFSHTQKLCTNIEADAVARKTFGSSRCRNGLRVGGRASERAGMHCDCRNVGLLVPDGSLNETQFRGVGPKV